MKFVSFHNFFFKIMEEILYYKGLFGTEGCKTQEREKTQEWERNRGVKQRIGKHRNFVETSVWNTGILIA